MKFSRYLKLSIFLVFFAGLIVYADNASKLPRTEILGKEYYIYEAKKGESVYGIAKKFDWNIDELIRLNPEANGKLQKGEMLYYPTGKVSVVTEVPQPVTIDPSSLEPIRHKVKKGETVYSISRQYGIPLEIIYQNNPSTKKGVKPGEIITMPQSGKGQYYYYSLKKGDSLSAISQKYNTSVEDIIKNNPGLSVNNLQEGETIRISINSNVGKVRTELVAEDRVSQISSYKVSKNETWDDISEKTGVEVEVLKEANEAKEDNEKPKENTVVHVPVVETVEVEKTVIPTEPEEMTEVEVQEMYDSIKGVSPNSEVFEGVRMAVILDEPNSKKDIDFSRGMLVALSKLKKASYKIDFKIIDGRVSTGDLISELDNFEPNIIVSTADKAFPLFLADYGNSNYIQVVNVFDLKNDLYEDNASMIQILAPVDFFNDRISTQLYRDNQRRKLIGVGDVDDNDGISSELFKLYDGTGENISLEEFGSLEPDVMQPLLIYSYANKKEEVADFMKNIENLSENNPGLDFKIVGRSSWITMEDDFGDQFGEYQVIIPSRIWIDEESGPWKEFEDEYESMFGGVPIRSVPNFAASGYDIAQYFIPLTASNKGDYNQVKGNIMTNGIQNDFQLSRVNNWGGFINEPGYLIRFRPQGKKEKVIVR